MAALGILIQELYKRMSYSKLSEYQIPTEAEMSWRNADAVIENKLYLGKSVTFLYWCYGSRLISFDSQSQRRPLISVSHRLVI